MTALPSPVVPALTTLRADGAALRAAADDGWEHPVPACPAWTVGELLGHTGVILEWAGRIVETGEAVDRGDRVTPPQDRAERLAWYDHHLERTAGLLASAPADRPTWVFASKGTPAVWWWQRRLAVELAIHRWDVEEAVGADTPAALDPTVASAGIAEHLEQFLPGLLQRHDGGGLTGTVHLHATDAEVEWWFDLDRRGDLVAVPEHRRADTAVRGTGSDLLLWLTNRVPADRLEVLGDADVARAFTALVR